MLNTPPTFAWYMAGLVFKWLKKTGGLAAMGERNRTKAQTLYAAIDGVAAVQKSDREGFPVPDERDVHPGQAASSIAVFLAEAAAAGLHGLNGHRVSGGMRASIYNAMPLAGVEALIEFMREFERRHA